MNIRELYLTSERKSISYSQLILGEGYQALVEEILRMQIAPLL